MSSAAPVSGSWPGWIGPSDMMIAGWLCSSSAASVPTGGLSQATTAIVPARPVASRCSHSASCVTSRPINEYRISRVPLRMPSEVAMVYSGWTSRSAS